MAEVGFAKAGDAWRWRGRRGQRPDRARGAQPRLRRAAKLKKQVRIDRFLHCIRLAKSRTLAQAHRRQGHVRIDGKRARSRARTSALAASSHCRLRGQVRVLRVLPLPQRRGPAREARACYEELGIDEPKPAT